MKVHPKNILVWCQTNSCDDFFWKKYYRIWVNPKHEINPKTKDKDWYTIFIQNYNETTIIDSSLIWRTPFLEDGSHYIYYNTSSNDEDVILVPALLHHNKLVYYPFNPHFKFTKPGNKSKPTFIIHPTQSLTFINYHLPNSLSIFTKEPPKITPIYPV